MGCVRCPIALDAHARAAVSALCRNKVESSQDPLRQLCLGWRQKKEMEEVESASTIGKVARV